MQLYHCPQRSPEWFELRRGIFTASEFAAYMLNPVSIDMNMTEISAELTRLGIDHKKSAKRDELINLLPNRGQYEKLVTPAQELIDAKLGEKADGDDAPQSYEDFWMRRGTALEPEAQAAYTKKTGIELFPIGIAIHANGMMGCSPDSFIGALGPEGVEMKCPSGKIQVKRLREKIVPPEYLYQIHGSMVITGAKFWDFFSYHPSLPPFYIRTFRNEITDQLEAGLNILVRELRRQGALLKNLYDAEFGQTSNAA